MDPIFLVGAVVVPGLLGVMFCVHYFSERQRTRRAIENTPRTPISGLKDGAFAKLTGRVAYLYKPVAAPLSGRPCAFYEIVVEEFRNKTWTELIRDAGGLDFFIEDETGRARVVNRSLKVFAVRDAEATSGLFDDASPQLRAFLARHGEKTTGLFLNRRLRCFEAVFEAGERVSVVGQIAFEPLAGEAADGGGYREAPKRAVISAPPGANLLASDDPRVTNR